MDFGAHLLGVVHGLLQGGETFAVALTCGVSPVGEVAAVSLQHLGLSFVGRWRGVARWSGPQVQCPVQVRFRFGKGSSLQGGGHSLDSVLHGKARKSRFLRWVSLPLS